MILHCMHKPDLSQRTQGFAVKIGESGSNSTIRMGRQDSHKERQRKMENVNHKH